MTSARFFPAKTAAIISRLIPNFRHILKLSGPVNDPIRPAAMLQMPDAGTGASGRCIRYDDSINVGATDVGGGERSAIRIPYALGIVGFHSISMLRWL